MSIRVKSSCIEEDCADPAIKVISRSSGECVTCFRCSQCPEGQRLSVACPSTVLEGTDIHCVPMVLTDPFSVSISRASAYATDVFFTLLASPSLISLKSSSTGTRPITESDISHIHNQPSISATSSAGSHPSINVAMVETKESDDSGSGQDSYVKVATLSGCGVALMFTIVVAIVYIFKKRGSTTICFLCDNNEEARPNLTSGSGGSESGSVLLSPENQKLKDAQQEFTSQENDNQPLLDSQTLSDDGVPTVPLSLDDCSLGEGIVITSMLSILIHREWLPVKVFVCLRDGSFNFSSQQVFLCH